MALPFNVYVPSDDSTLIAMGIRPRSAIVASQEQRYPDNPVIYYEGNLIGADNLHRFTERLSCAAGRASVQYPTTALARVPLADLTLVGTYDLKNHVLSVTDEHALAAWLDGEALA